MQVVKFAYAERAQLLQHLNNPGSINKLVRWAHF